jgi:hypothetical protein
MVERQKDEADRTLESLFRSEPVRDDGFSQNIVRRVRRQMWIQRLTLPVAIAIGALIAARPLTQLVAVIPELLNVVPGSVKDIADQALFSLPESSTFLLALLLLGAVMMVSRILEE